MNTETTIAPSFDPLARFASEEMAKEYLALHGKADAFFPVSDQGEYMILPLAGDAKAKAEKGESPIKAARKAKAEKAPAKAKGKAKAPAKAQAPAKGEGKAKGKASADQRVAKGLAESKAPAKAKKEWPRKGPARPLDGRAWIGHWAGLAENAAKGKGPDPMAAKAFDPKKAFYLSPLAGSGDMPKDAGIFWANTHRPFDKRIKALADLIRAKDAKGLKALVIDELSTTPIMLGKLRDLALAAFGAKAEKQNGKAKEKGPDQPQADQAITS